MFSVLLSLLFCSFQIEPKDTADVDVRPYVHTVIEDFKKRKDVKESDVVSLLIREMEIKGKDVIEISVFPEDSLWRFLLSNADSLGSPAVSIEYEEIDGQLFYWDVEGNVLTQEVYDKLMEYDFIERRDVPDRRYLVGERGCFQDGTKTHQYFFLKGNHKRFKRRYEICFCPPKRMFRK